MSGSSFFTKSYASLDHKMGRVGTAAAATGIGAGVGAGTAHLMSKSIPVGAGIGAGIGLAAEEAGRLLVDQDEYKAHRAQLSIQDTAKLLAQYGIETVKVKIA
jgi:uncharacterized spore protein YtfJ